MKNRLMFTTIIVTFALLLTACAQAAPESAPMAAPTAAAPQATAPAPAAPAPTPPAAAAPPPVAEAAPAAPPPPPVVSQEAFRRPSAEPDPVSNYFMLPTLTPSDADERRLAYTVSMSLQTTEFATGMSTLNRTVGSLGGYIIRADVRGYDMRDPSATRTADFVFRVPTERLDEFIFVVENNFNIWSLNQQMYEFTDWYHDTNWWIDELREEEAYLEELLETAEGDEREAALRRMTEVRRTLRDLDGTIGTIMSNVIYSTVDILLFEVIPEYEGYEDEQDDGFNVWFLATGILVVVAVVVVVVVVIVTQKGKGSSVKSGNTEI